MAFHLKTETPDPQCCGAQKDWRTEAEHTTVQKLERQQGKPFLVNPGVQFCQDLRVKGHPDKGKAADKAFRDSLYEKDA